MEDVKNSYNLKSSGIKYNFLDFMELQIYGKKLEDFDFEWKNKNSKIFIL